MTTITNRNNLEDIEELCRAASKEQKRVEQARLFSLDWKDRPETLLYKFHNGTFSDSGYFTVKENERVIAGAGYYQYENFTLLMSRFYVIPEKRMSWVGSSLLFMQVASMTTHVGMITCNEINKGFYDKLAKISGTPQSDTWPGLWRCFKPVGLMSINYVDQWCLEITKDDFHDFCQHK